MLDALYRDYDFDGRLAHDPISFPKRYRGARDIEAAGFVAASLAYGRVGLFMPVIDRVLGAMGPSPHGYLRRFSVGRARKALGGVSYRFQRPDDILALLYLMSRLIERHGSLEAAFMSHYGPDDEDTAPALAGFVSEALGTDTSPVYGENVRPGGLRQMFPSPRDGGACKRANLFLRWMVRDSDIDFGIWRGVPSHKLVIPLDTHIARVSRCLGLTERRSSGWKTAAEITRSLTMFDRTDPLKYDFALCHSGISGACSAGGCQGCELWN